MIVREGSRADPTRPSPMDHATAPATHPAPSPRSAPSRIAAGALLVALAAGVVLPGTSAASPALPQTSPAATSPAAISLTASPTTPVLADAARPRNGAVLTKRGSGSGRFTVDNSRGDADAVVTISDGGRAVLVLYVRGGSKATASNLPDGGFDVFAERGQNWNSAAGRFDLPSSTGKFDRRAQFTSKRSSRGTTYTTITVTLHAVPQGNARVLPVPETSVPS